MPTMQDIDPDVGLTYEQVGEILDRVTELEEAGKMEEAAQLFDKYIPIPPYIADAGKRVLGIDTLKESGVNLSSAVKAFGEKWLDSDG